jgi:ATP-binding cassette subfamily A (ABC1) protein 3
MQELDDFDMNTVRITSNLALFMLHTRALLLKRIRYFKRDIKSLCCEIFLPCAVVLGGLGLMSIQFINGKFFIN